MEKTIKFTEFTSPELQKQAEIFLGSLFEKVNAAGLSLQSNWDIDHLCFRVDSLSDYEEYKESFSKLGTLLTEAPVNGRPISTFELNYPIRYQNWLIRLIELPAPKETKKKKTGFEHIEVVVDCSLSNLSNRHPGFNWDVTGLAKIFNPELELSFGDCAIKFHNLSLKSVISFESRLKFAVMVSELRLFEIFQNHEPFIAGTIPLAIDGPESDIDFLVSVVNHDEFIQICESHFSGLTDFEIYQGHQNGADYSLCRFKHRSFPFEIYAAYESTFQQNGFVHFQVEEKILKYGPVEWRDEVIKLKTEGLKTEPAFAKLLNQNEEDPYQFLSKLQKKSIRELRDIIQTVKLIN